MSDRDRLIELLEDTLHEWECDVQSETLTQIAEHLLENGVIVPPCDIGQTVYTRYGYSFKIEKIEVLEDKKIIFRCGNDGTDDYMAFYDFEIGTDVFLTKEEAEAKLKELSNNG